MSMRTLDWSRPGKGYTVGGSLAVLGFGVAAIAAVMFWLASMMPNPVAVYEDVVIKPQTAVVKARIDVLVQECRAEQAAVDLKTSPTTRAECQPFESFIRSGQGGSPLLDGP